MCKAVLKAYEAYPLTESNRYNHGMNAKRVGYQQGYEQAEKDLELTWEDVSLLKSILFDVEHECFTNFSYEEFCREVLKRFKEQRT